MTKQYSVQELAKDLGVSAQYVRRYLKEHRIIGRKVGYSWVITKRERDRLIARQKRKKYLKTRRLMRALPKDSGELEGENYILPD